MKFYIIMWIQAILNDMGMLNNARDYWNCTMSLIVMRRLIMLIVYGKYSVWTDLLSCLFVIRIILYNQCLWWILNLLNCFYAFLLP